MATRRFLAELKHRRVYRAVGYYVVAAFALWQAADIAIPALSLPETWMTVIVAGALVGLPIVAVLAWLYDLNRGADGRLRSRSVRVAYAVAGVLVVGLLAAGLVHRMRRSGPASRGTPVERPVSLSLGIENYFGGEWAKATAVLDAVAADEKAPRSDRVEALRYAVRAYSESGDSVGARDATRRLLDLEPPLVLMLPGVETEAVMRLYYDARQGRLARGRAAGATPVRMVEVFDFNALGDPPAGVTTEGWPSLGRAVKEFLLTDMAQSSRDVKLLDRSTLDEERGFDIYRYLESPEGSIIAEATHLVIGSVGARGAQILISAWLIDVADGTLRAKSQRFARFVPGDLEPLAAPIDSMAEDLLRAMRPPIDSAAAR